MAPRRDVALVPGSGGAGSGGVVGGRATFGSAFAGIFWGAGTFFSILGLCLLMWAETMALLAQAILASVLWLSLAVTTTIVAFVLTILYGMVGGLLLGGALLGAVLIYTQSSPRPRE